MICPRCGANVTDGSTYCTSCGTALSSGTDNQYNQQYNQQQYGQQYSQQYSQQYGYTQQGYNQQQQAYSGQGYAQQYNQQQTYAGQYGQPQQSNAGQGFYQQNYNTNTQYGSQPFAGGTNNVSSDATDRVSPKNPVWSVPYSILKSPLFIIAAAAVTITFIINLITTFVTSNDLLDYFRHLLYQSGISGSDAAPFLSLFNGFSVFAFVACIPDLVLNIGLWVTFFLVAFSRPGTGKTGGLTAIKVILIIEEVFIWIAMFLFEIILLIALAGVNEVSGYGSYYGYGYNSGANVAQIAIIVLLVLLPVLFALSIAFYKGLRHSINAVKYTLNTGNASYEVSTYSGVMCIIYSSISILGMIINLANGVFSIATLFSATALMLFGIMMVGYKGKMTRAINQKRAMENGDPVFTNVYSQF